MSEFFCAFSGTIFFVIACILALPVALVAGALMLVVIMLCLALVILLLPAGLFFFFARLSLGGV
jgi:hypothetical protein